MSSKRKQTRTVAKGRQPTKNIAPSGALGKIERMEHPPQINGYQIIHNKRLRFTATAAANAQAISFQNLLDTILIATTAIQVYDLFDLVRIVSVEVWGIAALGTPSSVRVDFASATGDLTVHSDTSLGLKPAYVKAIPSAKSLSSFWQASAAGPAFVLTVPAGGVVDVVLEFKTTPNAPTVAQNASVAAAIGELFFRGLDGLASAGTNFPPPLGIQQI